MELDVNVTGRISIPYISPTGVLQIRYRLIGDKGGAKYLSAPGAAGGIFNASELTSAHLTVGLVEGEFDAITATSAVGLPTLAVGGTGGWKSEYSRAFRYRRVIVLKDAGEAGSKFASTVGNALQDVRYIQMEHDVNKDVKVYGAEALMAKIEPLLRRD